MRYILFRGKRIDNGEWMEGFYAQSGERTYIIFDNGFAVAYVTMKEVSPSTVGQYTGLTDKNGKKIFEGDCLNCLHNVVEFDKGVFNVAGDKLLFLVAKNAEVIGNIHDNPELLEAGHV